jgi:ribosomal protein S18 acetylase RimI-like enzyme
MDDIVRHFQPSDRDDVTRVACAAFAQYQHAYQDWPSFRERLARMADLAGQADLMVAEFDGQVAGAVAHVGPGKPRSSTFPDDWSVIRMLVVDPAFRGRGIAQQLVAACLRCAVRDGAPVVGLHTSPIMATALRLYTCLGFTRDRELDPIHGVPYARYLLPAGRVPAALALLAS